MTQPLSPQVNDLDGIPLLLDSCRLDDNNPCILARPCGSVCAMPQGTQSILSVRLLCSVLVPKSILSVPEVRASAGSEGRSSGRAVSPPMAMAWTQDTRSPGSGTVSEAEASYVLSAQPYSQALWLSLWGSGLFSIQAGPSNNPT